MSNLTKEQYELLKDEDFIEDFIEGEVCSNCSKEWGCREKGELGKCEDCKLIINLRNDYLVFAKKFKEDMFYKIDDKITTEEIDFLLLSEEERINTYKNCDEIWKSCVRKLEKQKEMLKDE